MQSHDVLVRVMQNHSDGRALNDSWELLDEIAKQFGKVMMSCDGFRNLQEGTVLRQFGFEDGSGESIIHGDDVVASESRGRFKGQPPLFFPGGNAVNHSRIDSM